MTAATSKITGKHGVLTIGSEQAIVDFEINVKRGIAEQPRVGKYSKFKQPGDIDISGSVTFQDMSGLRLAQLMQSTAGSGNAVGAGVTFALVGAGVDGTDHVTITLPVCFFTSGVMEFGDSNTIVDGPMDFAVQDADNAVLTYT